MGLESWLRSPAGRYLLAWEHAQLDLALVDCFGFHALQLGLPSFDALRANRMPHRWVAHDGNETSPAADGHGSGGPVDDDVLRMLPSVGLRCDFSALPFPSQSLDLVVLPHTLERSRDPHDTLREVERVLVPEGRVVIVGFNPASLWGLRQRLGHARRRVGSHAPLLMPDEGEFIGYWRLRDWLRLLGLEAEVGRFGRWRWPFSSERALQRMAWLERAGERWWPVFGALYFVVAVKRVRGMRMVGLARQQAPRPRAAPAAVAQSHLHSQEEKV
ncbi:MAG: class I SAM-dependent methyltransferase [Aquabacterium sp.]